MSGKKERWIGKKKKKKKMYMLYLSDLISKNFGNSIIGSIGVNNTSLAISVKKDKVNSFIFFFKNSTFFGFKSLIDIFGVDCLGKAEGYRFLVYYIFFNRATGFMLSLKTYLGLYDLVATVTNLYKAAGWAEREVYDMYGIFFHKNKDMRRILSDYGFVGFPLRKEFPLSGYFELQYSDEFKTIIVFPTTMGQAFRNFFFSKNWDKAINKE